MQWPDAIGLGLFSASGTQIADQPSRDLARVLLARCKEPDVWSTKRQRHTERLTFGEDDVGAARSRRFQQPERHGFGHCHDE